MAALLYHAHYNVSSTDTARVWGLPSKKKKDDSEEEVLTVEEMYPLKDECTPVKGEIVEEKIVQFRSMLPETNVVGFSWLLKPEAPESISLLVPSIEDILLSEEYLRSEEKVG